MFKIKYLPLAKKDLMDITAYIAEDLKNPNAAIDLLDAIEKSIERLQVFPYSCSLHQSKGHLQTEYRVLPVKSYLVFYTVFEHEVEIHRIIYSKMNLNRILT